MLLQQHERKHRDLEPERDVEDQIGSRSGRRRGASSFLKTFLARSNINSMTASDVPGLCKAVFASPADIGLEQSASFPASGFDRMMNRSSPLLSATLCNQKRFCINVADIDPL